MRLLTAICELFIRLWDALFAPRARANRAADRADHAVREHDERRVNEIFQAGKR